VLRRAVAVAVTSAAILSTRIAVAQDVQRQIAELEAQIAKDESALASADCSLACAALGSMRRAAERLCGLDPGPRCEAARAKVEDAKRRVRDACPQCAVSGDGQETPVQAGAAKEDAVPDMKAPPAPEPASAAPEPGKGGCAGCAIQDRTSPSGVAALAVAALAAIALGRRRRSA
jgi:MYXO-CTERM domain-containing protein